MKYTHNNFTAVILLFKNLAMANRENEQIKQELFSFKVSAGCDEKFINESDYDCTNGWKQKSVCT